MRHTVQHNVTTTDKLAIHIHLRDGRPVTKLLDTVAQFLVLQAVVRGHFVRVHALHLQYLEHSTAKATLRHTRRPLHEHYERVFLDGILDLGASFRRE